MSQDLISLSEAAELIGKNLRTIQRHIKSGKLTRRHENGKSYVSQKEVEEKFGVVKAKKVEFKKEPVVEKENRVRPPSEKTSDFQAKWIDEIQKHAATREELGVWKGRAEAYQNFAARLLGNGVDESLSKQSAKETPAINKSVKAYTYIIYALVGVFFIIVTVFILLTFKVI